MRLMLKYFFLITGLVALVLSMPTSSAVAAKKSDAVKIEKVDQAKTTTSAVEKTNGQHLDELKDLLQKTASTNPRTGEQINWFVISGGATSGASTNYALMGTVGQTAVGTGSSTNYTVNHGFWQDFGAGGGCCDLAGDFNNDGSVDITDLTDMVDFMFAGGAPAGCNAEADINADGSIDISDLTDRVDFMFAGGAAPVCGTVPGP